MRMLMLDILNEGEKEAFGGFIGRIEEGDI